MPKGQGYRFQVIGYSQEDGVVMWSACVQSTYNFLLGGGITGKISHRAAYKNVAAVYKHPVYAPASVQTRAINPTTYALRFSRFNRLVSKLIPTIHRAYYYLTTSFKLRKNIIGRAV